MHSIPILACLATLLIAVYLYVGIWPLLKRGLTAAISGIINKYLHWRFPIFSTTSYPRSIPTCPYQWPNGQGDVAKFLEGEANSDDWRAQNGRVYRIWSGTEPEIVLTHPEDIQTVFKDSDKHFKAKNNNSGWLMGEILGQCLGLISGTRWQTLRAATGASFTHRMSATYTEDVERATLLHLDELARQGNLRDGLLHPVDDFCTLPFWIVADILYGKLSAQQRSILAGLTQLRETLFRRMIQGGVSRFSWSRFLPSATNAQLAEFKRRWVEFNRDIHAACLATRPNAPIVAMHRAVESGECDAEELLQTLDEMLFANLDVTMGGLSWNLLFLAADQEVQDEVRAEVLHAKQQQKHQDGKAWKSYLTSSSSLLASCVLESARLKPLAAFSVPQSAPTARRVGDFMIPARTSFIVDTRALNIYNPFWGEDAESYRPARFLGRKASELRYQYWRFGFGPRQCIGKYTVDIIIRAILAGLLSRYRVRLDDTTSWRRKDDVWIAHPDTRIRCEELETME